jgi:predicted Zn finger-like uncharacterized protein
MASPLSSTVVIACPKCGTRYQLTSEALGPRGRKVSCAHCGETWQASRSVPSATGASVPTADGQARANAGDAAADPDVLFDPAAEATLDEALAAEERAVTPADPDEAARLKTIADIKAAIAPKPKLIEVRPDAAGDKNRQKAFDRRQAALSRQSPLARARRATRLGGVSILMTLLVGAVAFRTDLVKQFPDLAGAYEALGLKVNIIGLEFRDVTTLVTLKGGQNVMQVDGRIYSVAAHDVVVPPVVVTIIGEDGTKLYEWSVLPQARDLEPGEVVDFSTQLTSPPQAAARVKLTFTDGRSRAEAPVATAAPREG